MIMDRDQLDNMVRIARETGNFRELKRLQKIVRFHDPDFSYSDSRYKKSYLKESCYEKMRRQNMNKLN